MSFHSFGQVFGMCNFFLSKVSSFIIFLSYLSISASSFAADMLSVKANKVNMRSGPGIQHNIKWEYGTGFPFEVLKKQGDWLQVKDFEDEIGWIHKTHLSKSSHLIVRTNKDQDRTINIRSGPGNNNAVIGNAYHGVVFTKLEEKSDWVKVQHESGFTGWVKKSLLWGI